MPTAIIVYPRLAHVRAIESSQRRINRCILDKTGMRFSLLLSLMQESNRVHYSTGVRSCGSVSSSRRIYPSQPSLSRYL